MTYQKNTKTHNIYLLDKSKLPRKNETPENSVEDALAEVMRNDEKYELQVLKPGIETKGFFIKLYFREDNVTSSKFASFCKSFVLEGQKAVSFFPRTASSVLFVWNQKHIYAITTGQGFRIIEPYSHHKFGLIVASLFDNQFKITSLDSNAMSSIIHSTKTVYSNEVDFINISALDTVFKEVTGRLKDATKVRSFLNLPVTAKKKSMKVIAKNFVQFSSALNFDGLLHLLTVIDQYDFNKYQDRFNLITPLKGEKSESTIESINNSVMEEMYNAINSGEEIPFDLFHEDTAAYISADSYVFYDSSSGTVYDSFEDYTNSTISIAYTHYLNGRQSTLDEFKTFVRSVKIRADKGDIVGITDASLLQHISGEIQVSNSSYFIFYGKLYLLSKSYSERLNDSLRGKLRSEFFTSELTTKWKPSKKEDWFNETVSNNENYVHLHRVISDNIEFADLMKVENDVVTLVHVKDGFDGHMRELDRQVELSVVQIMDIKHNNNDSYFRTLYNNALSHTVGKNIKTVFPTTDDFISCIRNKPIRYVIAIRPAKKDLLENRSNIAKHCLNALILRCFQQGIEFKIQVL